MEVCITVAMAFPPDGTVALPQTTVALAGPPTAVALLAPAPAMAVAFVNNR